MKAVSKPREAAPITKARARTASFGDFVPDHALNEVERAAQFLDWAAQHMPLRFVPYTWIAKHAIIRPRLPGPDAPEVVMIRKKIGAIKRALMSRYSRRTVPAPRGQELGIRAHTDDDDLAGTDYLSNKRRIHTSIKRLEETRSIMDPTKMRDQGLKQMVTSMDTVMKKLTQPDLMSRLKELPPRPKDDE